MKKSLLKNRKPKEEYLALLRQEDINAWFSKNFSWDDVHEKSFCCGQEFFTKSSCNEYLEMCGMEFDMDFEDSFHRSFVFFFGKSSTINDSNIPEGKTLSLTYKNGVKENDVAYYSGPPTLPYKSVTRISRDGIKSEEIVYYTKKMAITFSNFGQFVMVENEDILNESQLTILEETLEKHGFVWLPNDILESPYDGEIEHYRPDYRGEKWRPKDLNFDPYAPPKDYPGNWRNRYFNVFGAPIEERSDKNEFDLCELFKKLWGKVFNQKGKS